MVSRLLIPIGALVFPLWAGAFQFTPTDLEWTGWPGYCQARYVTTNIGGTSRWNRDFPSAEISYWRNAIGEDSFMHVHHYCAGTVWFTRYRLEADSRQRQLMLDTALRETTYTYERIPSTSVIASNVAVTMAEIADARGETELARGYLEKAIQNRPEDALPYVALAVHHRRRKQLELAERSLLMGDKALDGKSMEIQYNLGLVRLELGNIEGARESALQVYKQEYPLPALRNKLIELGAWPESGPKSQP